MTLNIDTCTSEKIDVKKFNEPNIFIDKKTHLLHHESSKLNQTSTNC